ncbi:MAG: Serine-protein kinase RsbW [Bacteroidota bacterium]|jgi:serine/threonine-protein kinase RsbW
MSQGRRQLRFPSTLEGIHFAEKLVDDVCNEYSVKEDFYGEILICLTEAVNNAVVHGNKLQEGTEVSLTFELANEKTLQFTIVDEGPGFDFENLPDPTAPENIELPHGRGVFLMQRLADRCTFNHGGSEVILEFDVAHTSEA